MAVDNEGSHLLEERLKVDDVLELLGVHLGEEVGDDDKEVLGLAGVRYRLVLNERDVPLEEEDPGVLDCDLHEQLVVLLLLHVLLLAGGEFELVVLDDDVADGHDGVGDHVPEVLVVGVHENAQEDVAQVADLVKLAEEGRLAVKSGEQ